MSLRSRLRDAVSAAHVQLCLSWPTLLAIAACRPLRGAPAADVRSILLVRLDGLGDCVLTLPLVDALRRCFPAARLTVLTTPMAAPIFGSLASVDEVGEMRPALSARMPKYLRGLLGAVRAWWKHLRGNRFDVVVMPRWDADIYHATLLCALSRAPVAVGYADSTSPDKCAVNRGFQREWTHCLPAVRFSMRRCARSTQRDRSVVRVAIPFRICQSTMRCGTKRLPGWATAKDGASSA